MKKVLVLSYFFPPCNLTASQRSLSWAKYLKKFGYYPVIVTRRWDHHINKLADVSKGTPNEILHTKNEDFECYALPYKGNLRDRVYVKYGEKKFGWLRRALTLFELLLQNFFPSVIPYYNLFQFADNLVQKDKDIERLVITGNPFNLFFAGYRIKRKYGLKWVADYRDAWTTSEINNLSRPSFFRFIDRLDRHFEKKWVGTASLVTASSRPIADSITALTGTKGQPLYNGFMQQDFNGVAEGKGKFETFTITYVGTLYQGQKVEIMCNAFIKLIKETPAIKARLFFPGLAFYPEQAERVKNAMAGYETFYECTSRIERTKILEIEKCSHLLWHIGWDEQRGIIASKIYEYIASGSFIVVTPNDKGSIEEIINASGCGVCTSTVDETFLFLKKEYENYLQGKWHSNDVTQPAVLQFSRENQVKHLAELLNSI